MAQKTKIVLKDFFKTPGPGAGEKESQLKLGKTEYDNLIDSSLNLTDGGTVTSATTFSAGLANPTGLGAPTLTAKTQIANAASTALVANSHNLMPADGNACTLTLPTQAASTAGDVIILEWAVAIGNGQTQKIGTAGEFFMAKSSIYRRAAVEIFSVDQADGTGDDFANFIGLTNAGPGIGSYAVCTYNGSTWRMEARLTSSGNGSAANLSVFATT